MEQIYQVNFEIICFDGKNRSITLQIYVALVTMRNHANCHLFGALLHTYPHKCSKQYLQTMTNMQHSRWNDIVEAPAVGGFVS